MFIRATLLCLFISSASFAQQNFLPLNKEVNNLYGRHLHKKNIVFHTSVRPYIQSELDSIVPLDSIYPFSFPERDTTKKWLGEFWHNIKYDDFIRFQEKDLYFAINPLVNFSLGNEFDQGKSTYQNTRGLDLKAYLGHKVSIESRFYENQAKFPDYIYQQILAERVVPGQGRPRVFKSGGLDFAFAEGYLSYSPVKEFSVTIGHGKHFIGDGYRSMLWSDNAFNHPYLKLTMNVWKIKYMVLYNQMTDVDLDKANKVAGRFPRKFSTVHYLSIDIGKRAQLGFFEAIFWKAQDSTGNRGFELEYINPVIFLRPVEYSLSSPDNAVVGFNLNFKATDRLFFYSQVMIDDLSISRTRDEGWGFVGNKIAGQLGVKHFDLFGVDHLFIRAEYNVARPYTYAHKQPIQNYSHYNQSMAHPLGANFHEVLGFVNYRYKRLFGELKVSYAHMGLDLPGEHNGQNIFVSDFEVANYPNSFGNTIGQGVATDLVHTDLVLQYLVNPKINLNFEVKFSGRVLKNEFVNQRSSWLSFGLKTNLNNYYYDF